ncbi:lipoprotein-releasing ABC transporter permease subunit [Teredinibacter sp. KSP-S5-2]|uniref:lipoprotein-releasing ABC transporter permease subunit n=1 Tax=Teredinibacter sp. KSP-S5-2 TaxID=3034506 RepID=UPI0029349E86|nr:lipoprotein-releasing ABC transporter permease subunit [Teredinibacter sp. KSP-S5-2]WNO11254.1 lipoprotein-releasing ABC transporter permease subunit [Teredinibacter sp. KSP-S5-2]
MSGIPLFIGLRYTNAGKKNQLVSFLSIISTLGLIVGVSLLVAVLSIMNGFDRELREKILGLVPQAAIYQHGGIDDWQFVREKVLRDEAITAAAPFVQLSGLSRYKSNTSSVLLYGIDSQLEKEVSLIEEYIDPQLLDSLDSDSPRILLGQGLANKLDVVVGEKIMLLIPNMQNTRAAPKLQYFEVVGLLQSNTELDTRLALTSLTQASALSEYPGRVSGVRLTLKDIFSAPNVVYSQMLQLGAGFYGNNWTRTHGNLYHAIHMSRNLVGLLMGLIVAIAAFNVVSTLVMVVIEKKGDIAILRTMGASSSDIVKIFLVLGSVIGFIGTALGVGFGVLLAVTAQDLMHWLELQLGIQFLKSDVYPLTYLPSEILLSDIVTVGLTAMALSFLAAIYPAWKASRVQPAEALRYE